MSIACLGLFALVSFSTTLRIKEIGIRKVLGARLRNLILLLSKEYLLLLVIANLLAIPIIIFGARYWLANYAFRIDIGLDLFIVPAIVLLIISILTVGHRIYMTAKANPVDSLRAE
jgi:putative ABC transport system permease protein